MNGIKNLILKIKNLCLLKQERAQMVMLLQQKV